jgi:4-hydroxybenzoyl-CoA thioesterase
MISNRHQIYIDWGDCDPAAIVYYPRYFQYFDNCTHALFRAVGVDIHRMQRNGEIAGIPMIDTRSKFYVPAFYSDTVTVETTITRLGGASFEVHHRMLQDDTLSAEGFEKRVWTTYHPANPQKLIATRIPDEIRSLLENQARG